MVPSKALTGPSSSQAQENLFIQEIWEEGIPSTQEGAVNYFVDHDSSTDELPSTTATQDNVLQDNKMQNPSTLTTFMRLPQEGSRAKKKETSH